jgi:DNA repair exonuclease SbcCD nuclease subunit
VNEKLDTIIFAGDVFHDRHEIGVNTLYTAKLFFEILANYKIYIIPGNHDSFLSSTVEVNSVEVLENKNIKVFSKPTTVLINSKSVTFCPWKTQINELDPVDMLVGHFEIQNFKMNSTKICEHGDSSTDLLEKASSVITGHFHMREKRDYTDNKYILYLGSPYQMDFGDRGQQRGISIIDFDDMSVNFIENYKSPKHYRIKISELTNNTYKNLPSIIKDNIISVYVDTVLDTLTLDLLTSKLLQYKPLQFRTEFNILDQKVNENSKDLKKLSIDIETAFYEFVEHIETKSEKKQILDKCLELYRTCQTSYE